MLFRRPLEFEGLPEAGFGLFEIRARAERLRAITTTIHPPLNRLGEDLVRQLAPKAAKPLHYFIPRLDWPRDYQPFCTWLVISERSQGYQSGPQLNVGVHADHVAVRLGWDTGSTSFSRFEFLCRHGGLDHELLGLALAEALKFRIYASAPWPEGSRLVCQTDEPLVALDEVHRHGLWWEVGRRHDLPEQLKFVCSPELGQEVARLFEHLLPLYQRLEGVHEE